MKFGTITHDASGVRIDLGNGSVRTFANIARLAEDYAHTAHSESVQLHRNALLRDELERLKRLAMQTNSDLTPITVIESITQILADDVE